MRWQDLRQSGNVEDRRGFGAAGGQVFRTGGLGIGGLLVVLLVSYLFGVDPTTLMTTDGGGPGVDPSAPAAATGPLSDEDGRFASSVLADTEDTWTPIFTALGRRYPQPTLVLFTDSVDSACGLSSAAVGPFYCPSDHKVYLDLSFYNELDRRFGAPGDFARAYVIAHEVGHHVQNLLGTLKGTAGLTRAQANSQSVSQELQADCLAGVWGHAAAARNVLEAGDVDEGLAAAAAVGDDRLQQAATGRVAPESFTHGSSADRAASFKRGLQNGDIRACGFTVQ